VQVKTKKGYAQITSIQPVGRHVVWDLNVARDYSYVAEGIVHHNSSDMNLQNIPKILAGYNIKKLFITDNQQKLVFVNVDYKGAEVRVFTAYARDPALIKALNDGLDMHSFFAATVFKRPYADYDKRDEPLSHMTEEYCKLLNRERTQIKRVVFGILYGAGPKKIAEQIGVSDEEGQKLIDMLFEMFPAIRDYIDEVKYLVSRDGYVDTIFGRRRRFPLMATSRHRSRAERQACNFKIQSTSSDIVIAQLIEMHDVINSNQTWPEWGIHKPLHTYGTRVLLTVHDSIGFQWPKELLHALEAWVTYYGETRVREKFPWLPVPFKIDIEVGPSYGECVALPKYLKNNPANNLEVHDDDEIEILNTLRQDAFEGAA
jgi:DNA polymerase-1